MPEYSLVFPKILCGLMPDEPVARVVLSDDVARSEGESLLAGGDPSIGVR